MIPEVRGRKPDLKKSMKESISTLQVQKSEAGSQIKVKSVEAPISFPMGKPTADFFHKFNCLSIAYLGTNCL
ncbi:hypothetical protein DCC39_08950 [Pueribacillus theae]|uniref:Uncharacterized protein n=1 Tax=Pueribacillus theae TaxID=2171751 RepID=A0A2U1K3Z5_9BACI|nr:hypothetical protein DCC39_08950 [Pueribacillus theae]